MKHLIFSTTFKISLIVFAMIFAVMYLIQVSSVSTKGYEISDLEGQIQELQQENQKLDYKIATYRSMKSIQERLQNTEMVPVNNVEYVTLVGTAVALK
jgi:cell division protein FtsL